MDTFKLEFGSTRMTVADPRVAEPYYRGTRFDRTGIILSLESGGHRYVQPWQRHYDPYSHDAVSGPAEEFLPVRSSTSESASGDGRSRLRSLDAGAPFLKIGVGLLQGDGEPYDRFKLYEVLDPGQMTIILGKNAETGATGPEPSEPGPSVLTFRQVLDGYYDYEKLVEIPAEGRLRIFHRLTNRSTLLFDTYVYCHNFFILDGAPTGRATRFTFPFRPIGDWRAPYDSVRLSDRGIVFDRDLAPSETVFMGNLRPDPSSLLLPDLAAGSTNPALNAPPTDSRRSSMHTGPVVAGIAGSGKEPRRGMLPAIPASSGPSTAQTGYRFTLQNLDNNLRVEAECDRAMDYAVFWSNADVSCLEPYIPLRLAPGQTARWTLNYRFC